jgi:hypothetical protein
MSTAVFEVQCYHVTWSVEGSLTVSMYSPFGAAFRAAGLDIMRRGYLENLDLTISEFWQTTTLIG